MIKHKRYEITEQLDRRIPDCIACPVGNGIIGVYKALIQFFRIYTNELGHLPKILDSRRIIMIL